MSQFKVVLLGIALLGCQKPEKSGQEVPVQPKVQEMAPEPPKPVEPPKVERYLVSFEKGDVVDECVHLTLTAPEVAVDDLEKVADTMMKKIEDKEMVTIKKSCEEQFHDRTILGTCRFTKAMNKAIEGVEVQAVWINRAYNVDTVDTYMKDCMELEGDWTAAAKEEADRERLRQHSKKLMNAADNL